MYGGWGWSEYRRQGLNGLENALGCISVLFLNSELKFIHAILIALAMSLEEGGREGGNMTRLEFGHRSRREYLSREDTVQCLFGV